MRSGKTIASPVTERNIILLYIILPEIVAVHFFVTVHGFEIDSASKWVIL